MFARSNLEAGLDETRPFGVEFRFGYFERDVMEGVRFCERALVALEGNQNEHLGDRNLSVPGSQENGSRLSRRGSQNLESEKVTVETERRIEIVNVKDDLGKPNYRTHNKLSLSLLSDRSPSSIIGGCIPVTYPT